MRVQLSATNTTRFWVFSGFICSPTGRKLSVSCNYFFFILVPLTAGMWKQTHSFLLIGDFWLAHQRTATDDKLLETQKAWLLLLVLDNWLFWETVYMIGRNGWLGVAPDWFRGRRACKRICQQCFEHRPLSSHLVSASTTSPGSDSLLLSKVT